MESGASGEEGCLPAQGRGQENDVTTFLAPLASLQGQLGEWGRGLLNRRPVLLPVTAVSLLVLSMLVFVAVLDSQRVARVGGETVRLMAQSLQEHAAQMVDGADQMMMAAGRQAFMEPDPLAGGGLVPLAPSSFAFPFSPPHPVAPQLASPVAGMPEVSPAGVSAGGVSPGMSVGGEVLPLAGAAAMPQIRALLALRASGELLSRPVSPALLGLATHQLEHWLVEGASAGAGSNAGGMSGKPSGQKASGPKPATAGAGGAAIPAASGGDAVPGVSFGPLMVSLPLVPEGENDSVILLGRMVLEEGEPAGERKAASPRIRGVVIAVMDAGYFGSFYRAVSLSGRAAISVLRTDGRLLVREPYWRGASGRDMSGHPLFRQMIPAAASGEFEDSGSVDGIPRLFSYATLRNAPLVVVVGLATLDVYASWRERVLMLSVLGLLLVGLVAALLNRAHRQMLLVSIGEQRVRRTELHLSRAQSIAHVGSWDWDLHNNCLWWSPEMRRIYGLDTAGGELVPSWELFLSLLHPQDRGRVAPVLARALGDGQGFCLEYRISLPDGGLRHIRHEGQCILDSDGSVARMDCVVQDTTDNISLQSRLIQAGRLSTLGEMASGMVHELSQPLNILRMSAELALLEAEEDDAMVPARVIRQTMERITGQADRMGSVLEQIRLFSRQDHGEVQQFDVVESVDKAVRMMEPVLRGAGIFLSVHLPGEPLVVNGLAVQLEQVVLSFLVNARDAIEERFPLDAGDDSGKGQGVINLIVQRVGHDVLIRVQDNGTGISAPALGRMFEPFFTTRPVGRGSGLGLSVSYGIIVSMGGTIGASNREQGGACLEVRLPLVPAGAVAGHSSVPSSPAGSPGHSPARGEASPSRPGLSQSGLSQAGLSQSGLSTSSLPRSVMSQVPAAEEAIRAWGEALAGSPGGDTRVDSPLPHVLLVEGSASGLDSLRQRLQLLGYRLSVTRSADEAYAIFVADPAAILVFDISLMREADYNLVISLRNIDPLLPVVLLLDEQDEAPAASSLPESDATTIVRLPSDLSRLPLVVDRLARRA